MSAKAELLRVGFAKQSLHTDKVREGSARGQQCGVVREGAAVWCGEGGGSSVVREGAAVWGGSEGAAVWGGSEGAAVWGGRGQQCGEGAARGRMKRRPWQQYVVHSPIPFSPSFVQQIRNGVLKISVWCLAQISACGCVAGGPGEADHRQGQNDPRSPGESRLHAGSPPYLCTWHLYTCPCVTYTCSSLLGPHCVCARVSE